MIKKITAAVFALCLLLTGCGKNGGDSAQTSISEPPMASAPDNSAINIDDPLSDEETVSIYTGKVVENEEDLAIFKFNCTIPDGYQTIIDSAEGKQFACPYGGIVVKAQNFKEEFQDLEVFADQGCASIKLSSMMNQADCEFSEPIKTKIAGFDAIRYDYTVTVYVFKYETDAQGNKVLDDEGNPIITDEKEIYSELKNRVYYFYSDEDVFYIICESMKENADQAAEDFDKFIESITITKK